MLKRLELGGPAWERPELGGPALKRLELGGPASSRLELGGAELAERRGCRGHGELGGASALNGTLGAGATDATSREMRSISRGMANAPAMPASDANTSASAKG